MPRRRLSPDAAEALGDRLRRIRGGETQERFAERLGVTRGAYASYEAARRVPHERVLARLSGISGRTREELLYGVGMSRGGAPPGEPPVDRPSAAGEEAGRPATAAARDGSAAEDPRFDPRWLPALIRGAGLTDDEIALLAVARLCVVGNTHLGPFLALLEAAERAVADRRVDDVSLAEVHALRQFGRRVRGGAGFSANRWEEDWGS